MNATVRPARSTRASTRTMSPSAQPLVYCTSRLVETPGKWPAAMSASVVASSTTVAIAPPWSEPRKFMIGGVTVSERKIDAVGRRAERHEAVGDAEAIGRHGLQQPAREREPLRRVALPPPQERAREEEERGGEGCRAAVRRSEGRRAWCPSSESVRAGGDADDASCGADDHGGADAASWTCCGAERADTTAWAPKSALRAETHRLHESKRASRFARDGRRHDEKCRRKSRIAPALELAAEVEDVRSPSQAHERPRHSWAPASMPFEGGRRRRGARAGGARRRRRSGARASRQPRPSDSPASSQKGSFLKRVGSEPARLSVRTEAPAASRRKARSTQLRETDGWEDALREALDDEDLSGPAMPRFEPMAAAVGRILVNAAETALGPAARAA